MSDKSLVDKVPGAAQEEGLNKMVGSGLTLQQALFLFISLLMVLLLIVSFSLSVSATRDYLQKQLHSHAQDAATSLGLSLSTSIDARDQVKAERIIDAMYDSGDYKKIVFFDTKGAAIVIKSGGQASSDVPEWFEAMIHLTVPAQSAQVVSGWSQLGTVVVESHTRYAYSELWRYIQRQALWFLLIAVLALLLTKWLLRGILKPLRELELQAHEMSARRFDHRASVPKARELANVANAMNEMADHLGTVFSDQLALIESLRKQSFLDPLTGLSNREGFDGRLKTELDSQQTTKGGSLMLVQIHDFSDINEAQGRQAGDVVLISVANQLRVLLQQYHGSFAARRSGADFSLFLPSLVTDDVDMLAQSLLAELCSLAEIKHLLRSDSVHIGVACVRDDDSARTLFSKADLALRQAQTSGISAWQRYAHIETAEESMSEVRQANEWRAVLQDVLAQRSVKIHTQTVFDIEKVQLYEQVLSRIELDDELVVAGVFLPMAERFGLMVPFDQMVLERVIESIQRESSITDAAALSDDVGGWSAGLHYCITLSEYAVTDARFLEWLEHQLQAHPEIADKLMIEVTEHIISYNEESLLELSELLERYGVGLSIERFGVSSVPFSYLQRVQIDVIKVDHSFIRSIHENQSNQFFLRSAIQIAHGQGIQVVAVGVESEEEWLMLKSLGIDGAMGYYLEHPQPSSVFA